MSCYAVLYMHNSVRRLRRHNWLRREQHRTSHRPWIPRGAPAPARCTRAFPKRLVVLEPFRASCQQRVCSTGASYLSATDAPLLTNASLDLADAKSVASGFRRYLTPSVPTECANLADVLRHHLLVAASTTLPHRRLRRMRLDDLNAQHTEVAGMPDDEQATARHPCSKDSASATAAHGSVAASCTPGNCSTNEESGAYPTLESALFISGYATQLSQNSAWTGIAGCR